MIFKRSSKSGVVPRRRMPGDEPRQSSAMDDGAQFRRNQTLSGMRRAETQAVSERTKAHHLTSQRRKIGGIFLLVIAAIIVLGGLLTQFTARVIVASSKTAVTTAIEPKLYEDAINEYLAIHPVERLRFVQNETALAEFVSVVAPEVSGVEITSADNFVESNYTMTFRKPVAGWQINNRQYFVDDKGIVFDKNYYEAPTVQIIDQSGISPEQGSTVASSRLLSFVGRVVALSGQGSYTVVEVRLPVGTTRQLEIKIKDIQPFVKLSIDRGAGEQVEDMIRTLKYLDSQGRGAEYIDVRVAGRAVYH